MIPATRHTGSPRTWPCPSTPRQRLAAPVARGDPRSARTARGARPGAACRTRVGDAATAQFPLRVPRGFVARMRHGDPHDPLLRQVLPLDDEDRVVPGFGLDAVGDARRAHGDGRAAEVPRPRAAGRPPAAARCIAATASAGTFPTARKARHATAGATPSTPSRGDATIDEVHPLRRRSAVAGDIASWRELTDALAHDPAPQAPAHPHPPADRPARARRRRAVRPGWRRCRGRSTVVVHANHANEFDAAVDAAMRRPARTRAARC